MPHPSVRVEPGPASYLRVRLDRPTLPAPVVREARRRFGPTKRRLLRRADDLWHRRGDT